MDKQSGTSKPDVHVQARSGDGDAAFEGWGMKLPLPRWALYCIAALVVAASALTLYAKVALPLLDQLRAQAFGTAQFEEYQRHFTETPRSVQTLFDNDDLGTLTVAFYSSDRCLLVTRKVPGAPGAPVPHWILAKSIEHELSPGQIASVDRVDHAFRVPLLASASLLALPVQVCRMGRCLYPHAGTFQSWNGETRGCWVQVWRRWPDGCQHYQWFNKCNSYWDSDQNGPKLFWNCCNH